MMHKLISSSLRLRTLSSSRSSPLVLKEGRGWIRSSSAGIFAAVTCLALTSFARQDFVLPKISGAKPRNIIFVLIDDQRYDAMGFMGHPFLETPHMDSMAKNGVHLKNAFVTTSLCSPSRASILTGLYAHRHRVVDNYNPIPAGTIYFSQYLKAAGYETGYFGKWHMGGERDDPHPGWDRWVSFKGQGTYLPGRNGFNVDGERVPQKGYVTDEITDYALDWLRQRRLDKPFMAYISHKAVHAEFIPAERHAGKYRDKVFNPPRSQANTPENNEGKPMWMQNQRNSWHGVDFPYHGQLRDISEFYKSYCETLLAVDENLGRVLDFLRERGIFDSTLVIFMGDNGFHFGEQGLIDKRVAYETSMRVPMLMQCPEMFKAGGVVEKMVANIDIAPTILEAAGLRAPDWMDGRSFVPVAQGKDAPWRETLLYEYFWERNFPHTPTMHALRGNRYKYIRYQGLWDIDELYDLENDPGEEKNLVFSPEHKQILAQMNRQLFEELAATEGMYIPLNADRGGVNNLRRIDGSEPAEFPPQLMREGPRPRDTDAPPTIEIKPGSGRK